MAAGPPAGLKRTENRMAEKFVAKASEFNDGDRRIVFVGDHEIGVFRHEGRVFRLQQFLPAPGRPGLRRPDHRHGRGAPAAGQDLAGLYFSDTEMHFVCPWHGMEYDMKTGECVSDRKMKLRSYKVLEKGMRSMSSRKAAAAKAAPPTAKPSRQAGPQQAFAASQRHGVSADAITSRRRDRARVRRSDQALSPEAMQALMAALCRSMRRRSRTARSTQPIPEASGQPDRRDADGERTVARRQSRSVRIGDVAKLDRALERRSRNRIPGETPWTLLLIAADA